MVSRYNVSLMEEISIEDLPNIPIAHRYPPEATKNLKNAESLNKKSVLKSHGIGIRFNAPTISIPFSSATNIHMLSILPLEERDKIEKQKDRITGNKYIKIKYYQRLMMKARGYDISKESWDYAPDQGLVFKKNYEKFIEDMNKRKKSGNVGEKCTSLLDFTYSKVDHDGKILTCSVFYVFPDNQRLYCDIKQFKQDPVLSKSLKPILLITNETKPTELILITPSAIKTAYIEQFNSDKLLKHTKTSIFNEKYFLHDVTDHILQPLRSKRIIPVNINDEESVNDAKMLKERKVDLMLLPNVPFNDSYAKYYGYNTGDIIKLEERVDYLNLISDSLISYVRIGPYRNLDKK